MSNSATWYRKFHNNSAAPELLVFPHAGTGASAYRDFSQVMSQSFDVSVVQYPGRQDRRNESPLDSITALAQGAFAALDGRTFESPPIVFGHSMGSVVAFEFVRLLEDAHQPVRLLAVSAAVSPARVRDKPPHPTEDDKILRHLATLEGTDAALFADDDLVTMMLPVIKKDYAAFDAYTCDSGARVRAPIHVMGGSADPIVRMGDLYAWGEHTDSRQVTVFDGGHFYLYDVLPEVRDLLASSL